MLRILTLPGWNCRLPAGLRKNGEDYWNRAELPLAGEWVFIVNFVTSLSSDAPVRSLVVVAIEQLLAVVQEVGCESIQSVYQISCGSAELSHAVEMNRIESVWAGKLEDESGRVIFSFKTESGEPLYDEDALAAVERLNRLTKLFEFRVPGTAT
jgi:hypothetical protein